jgi:hypothetical protein
MKYFFFFVVCFLFIGCGSGGIEGYLVSSQGSSVSGVLVEFTLDGDSYSSESVYSDSAGYFVIEDLTAGDTFNVHPEGSPYTKRATVEADSIVSVGTISMDGQGVNPNL